MLFRMCTVAMVAAAMFVGAGALNAGEVEPTCHDGKFVSISDDTLVKYGLL